MAITRVENLFNKVGELNQVFFDLDGPASYLAGGQTVNASDLGLRYIHHVVAGLSDNGAHHCSAGQSTKGTATTAIKVAWLLNSTGVEVANAVDLSGRFVRVVIYGR